VNRTSAAASFGGAGRRRWAKATRLWRMPEGMAACAALCAAGLSAALMGGCRNAEMERQLDAARADRLMLRGEVADLERRNRELETALAMSRAAFDEDPQRTAQRIAAADLPRITEVRVGRYSRLSAAADGGVLLQVWLEPRDGRGRFLQLAGPIAMNLVHIPVEGEPIGLMQIHMTAEQVRDAYRSFLTGTHYAIERMLPEPPPADGVVVLHVEYIDDWTGGTVHRTSAVLRLHVR